MRGSIRSVLVGVLLVAFDGVGEAASAGSSGGVVVEGARRNYGAHEAGIRPGDVLTSWSRVPEGASAQGPIRTTFDLAEVEREHRPRYEVALHGIREGQKLRFSLGPRAWRVKAKPRWDRATDARYREVMGVLEGDDEDRARREAEAFARSLGAAADALHVAWFWMNAAEAATENGRPQRAQAFYERAVAFAQRAKASRAEAYLLHRLGMHLMRQGRYEASLRRFTSALDLEESISPSRLGVAANRMRQGSVTIFLGKPGPAIELLKDALRLQERRAPKSLVRGRTYSELGRATDSLGDLPQGEQYFRRALQIVQKEDPGSTLEAGFLLNTALAMLGQGKHADAEGLFVRAERILRRLDPGSRGHAHALGSLGSIKEDRGDFRAAESYFRRAYAMSRKLSPDSVLTIARLSDVGVAAMLQGNWAEARSIHETVLSMRKARGPGSLDVAMTLSHLGKVARFQKDFDAAASYFNTAIAIFEGIETLHPELPRAWLNLGLLEGDRGNEALAVQHLKAALRLNNVRSPRGRDAADILVKLGHLTRRQGANRGAQNYYARALEIAQSVAPDSYIEAEALYGLAEVDRARGNHQAAEDLFDRALSALEAQHGRLGGTGESKAALLDEHQPLDTAIVLSPSRTSSSGEDNGFLQAWEVYERVRLEAELVTLSACETALGTPYPGEGLIGLTRAFQYAGASSVLASLWKVNDRSTGRLMGHFYDHLRQGVPLTESLRRAQMTLIHDQPAPKEEGVRFWLRVLAAWWSGEDAHPNHAHPYYWAGFVLNGLGGE